MAATRKDVADRLLDIWGQRAGSEIKPEDVDAPEEIKAEIEAAAEKIAEGLVHLMAIAEAGVEEVVEAPMEDESAVS
jgi:hypothetical protein